MHPNTSKMILRLSLLPLALISFCAGAMTQELFFFSSRRRHTRCLSDWSSDVCSSDLVPLLALTNPHNAKIKIPAIRGDRVDTVNEQAACVTTSVPAGTLGVDLKSTVPPPL